MSSDWFEMLHPLTITQKLWWCSHWDATAPLFVINPLLTGHTTLSSLPGQATFSTPTSPTPTSTWETRSADSTLPVTLLDLAIVLSFLRSIKIFTASLTQWLTQLTHTHKHTPRPIVAAACSNRIRHPVMCLQLWCWRSLASQPSSF